MHIVVMGAGGVGGYFGAKLARAGETVTLIARGEHLTAIQRDGLRIRSSVEGESVVRLAAVEDVRGLSAAEVILFCVKSFDTETAAERIRPIVRPDTAVLRSEEHTSELQSHSDLVCRLLLEKKNRAE